MSVFKVFNGQKKLLKQMPPPVNKVVRRHSF